MKPLSLLSLLLLACSISGCATQPVPIAVATPCPVRPLPPPSLMVPPVSPDRLNELSKALSQEQNTTPPK